MLAVGKADEHLDLVDSQRLAAALRSGCGTEHAGCAAHDNLYRRLGHQGNPVCLRESRVAGGIGTCRQRGRTVLPLQCLACPVLRRKVQRLLRRKDQPVCQDDIQDRKEN